jgi:hypothetical protein
MEMVLREVSAHSPFCFLISSQIFGYMHCERIFYKIPLVHKTIGARAPSAIPAASARALRDIYIGFLRKRESSVKEGSASRSYVGLERMYVWLLIVIGSILGLYSVFLPLAFGTVWFYAGLAVYLTGWTFMVLATLVFIATPADKPNTTGIYSISRHPIYLGWSSVFISMGIASASWVYILLALVSLAPIRMLL